MSAVLFIDMSSSMCGACSGNASPYEDAHLNETMRGEGCGETYVAVSSNYMGGDMERRVREMRPDLPWLPFDEAKRGAL